MLPQHSSKKRVLCYEFDPEADVIGKGAYGEVYRATVLRTEDDVVALKRTLCAEKEEGIPASTVREIMVLREISRTMRSTDKPLFGAENVVKLHDVFMDKNMVYVASEFCEAGDLSCYLKTLPERRLTDRNEYRHWMWDMLSGLCFLHRKEFSHRDLKPQNIVLKAVPCETQPSPRGSGEEENGNGQRAEAPPRQQYKLKITDFGLSRVEGIPVKKYQHEAVTLWYRSPDVLLGNTNYHYTADMWSVGCIMAEVASGNALFRGKNNFEQLKCIFARLGVPTESNFPSMKLYALYVKYFNSVDGIQLHEYGGDNDASTKSFTGWIENAKSKMHYYFTKYRCVDVVGEDGIDLITRLLTYEPENRLTAEEALQHPFFSFVSRSILPASKETPPPVVASASAATEGDSPAPTSRPKQKKRTKMGRSLTKANSRSQTLQSLPTMQSKEGEEGKDTPYTQVNARANTVEASIVGGGGGPNELGDKDVNKPRKRVGVVPEERNNSETAEINKAMSGLEVSDGKKKILPAQAKSRMSVNEINTIQPKSIHSTRESRVVKQQTDGQGFAQILRVTKKGCVTHRNKQV